MGNKNSKREEERVDISKRIDFSKSSYVAMDKIMGTWYHEYVPYLAHHYGFNGGFSVSHLTQTKVHWATHKVKNKDKEFYNKCGEIIGKWLEEAMRRQQKQGSRAIAPSNSDKEREEASKKALQDVKTDCSTFKNDCSNIPDGFSPFFGQFMKMMMDDGGYPARRPPALNPGLSGAAAGESPASSTSQAPSQASAPSEVQASAPAAQPPSYTPREDSEEAPSSTRSGTVYNDEGRKECSKILEELLNETTAKTETVLATATNQQQAPD